VDDAIEQWFEDVKIRREGADDRTMESVPEPPMTRNSLVDELMGDRRRD
jgi:hypothetical protein